MEGVGDQRARSAPLDGLRALLALSVVTTHAFGWVGAQDVPRWQFLLAGLADAVPAFFALSGFLLAMPYVRALDGGPWPSLGTFAVRRALRILPAYWTVLGLSLLLLGTQVVPGIDLHTVWLHLLLQQNYDDDTLFKGLGAAWTLAVEVQFYVALPLLALALRGLCRRHDPVGVVLVTAACLFAVGSLLHGSRLSPLPSLRYEVLLLGQVQWFALGIALAALRHRHGRPGPVKGPFALALRHPVVAAAVAVATFVVAEAWLGPRRSITFDPYLPLSWPIQLVLHDLVLAITVGLALGLAVFHPAGVRDPVRRALGSRGVSTLGLWTYSVYLIHGPVGLALHDHFAPSRAAEFPGWLGSSTLTLLVAMLAITMPLAAVSYRFLEAPFLRARVPPIALGAGPRPALLRAAARRRA